MSSKGLKIAFDKNGIEVGMRVKELDLDLLPTLKKLDVAARRKILSRILEGSWTTMLKGRGMEFAGFRKYTFGDDASAIDWGATLRSKETLIREFEEYKNVTVFMILDVSDSMLLSSTGKTKAEYGAELLFNLGVSILDNSDAVGFGMISNQILAKVQPGIGKEIIYHMAHELQDPKNYGGSFDLKVAVELVESFLKERALIVLISDFIGVSENWERYIRMLAQKYDVVGIALRDPRDRMLPDIGAQMLVEDPFSNERIFIDAREYRQLYADATAEDEKYLRSVFEKSHAGFLLLETGEDPFPPLLTYFRKRMVMTKA